jgi:hypothetical protein
MNNSLQQRDRIEDKIIRRIDREKKTWPQSPHIHATIPAVLPLSAMERTARNTRRQRPLTTVGDMILHQAARSKNGSMLRMLGAGFGG